jgi:hypothetical protein
MQTGNGVHRTASHPGRRAGLSFTVLRFAALSTAPHKRGFELTADAAFDTRTGKVYGASAERKRQKEFIEFLDQWDREIPAEITLMHIVLDNLRMLNPWTRRRHHAASPRRGDGR